MEYPSSESNSDLEWMLLSGQAGQGELAEALLVGFYAPVYRLGVYLLGNPTAASATASDVFVAALLNAYAYRSATGVRLWLFELAVKIYLEKRRKLRPGLSFLNQTGVGIESITELTPAPSPEDQRIWSTLDASGYRTRYSAFLHFCLGLEASEIVQIQHIKASEVAASLMEIRQQLGSPGSDSTPASEDPDLFAQLNQSLQKRWPAPELEVHDLAKIASHIVQKAGKNDANRRKMASLKEMSLVGAIILVVVGLTWGINRYMPEPQPTPFPTSASLNIRIPTRTNVIYFVQSGDTLESIAARLGMPVEKLIAINAISTADPLYSGEALWVDISSDLPPAATPVTPLPPAEPLTLKSTSQAIQDRLQQSASLWTTLWADIQNYPNGRGSTVGLNNQFRDQIWVSQPNQSMEIFGLPDQVYLRRIASGGRGYTVHGRPGEAYIDNIWVPLGKQVLINPLLQALIFPGQSDWIRPGWRFEPVASETTANRPALVVEWINPQGVPAARLWIDASTGVILRRQFLDSAEPDRIISEMVVTDIAFNVDIPAPLFDPEAIWQGGFAADYTGNQALK